MSSSTIHIRMNRSQLIKAFLPSLNRNWPELSEFELKQESMNKNLSFILANREKIYFFKIWQHSFDSLDVEINSIWEFTQQLDVEASMVTCSTFIWCGMNMMWNYLGVLLHMEFPFIQEIGLRFKFWLNFAFFSYS